MGMVKKIGHGAIRARDAVIELMQLAPESLQAQAIKRLEGEEK